ncbi:MAG: transporter [Nitrospirota bacterium]
MNKIITLIFLIFLSSSPSFGAHPLITDDSGTVGAGKFQLELNGEYSKDGTNSTTEIAATVTGGIKDKLDIVFSAPYQFLRSRDESDNKTTEDGISDIAVELKWRLYEKEEFGLALKPGITFPSGDDDKGLGDGKPSYGLVFITTKEIDPVTLHMNIGFTKNRKELRDIWHYSLATEYEIRKNLLFVANIGVETNPEKESNTHPVFLLGGFIYSLNDNFDIDLGIKAGLNKAEPDYTVLAGLAIKL